MNSLSISGQCVTVTYPHRPVTITIALPEYTLIKNLPGNKLACIKFIRDQYNLGLYEAKQIVDTIHAARLL